MNEPKDLAAMQLSAKELGILLGLTDRRIRQLADEGVVVRAGKRAFALNPSVKNYIGFIDQQRDQTHTTRLQAAKATKAEIELKRIDREIITLEEALGTMDEITGLFLTALSSLPGRLSTNIAQRRNAETVIDAIRLKLVEDITEKMTAFQEGK